MKKPLRYIIVGIGEFGVYWCRDFLPRLAEMRKALPVAAVDINPQAVAKATQFLELPQDKCYTDIEKAFDENPAEFVIVVVPPASHESVVDMALAHDMHVLSEKPLADTMEASCRILNKVKAADKKMAVTMSHRFDQDKQSLEHAIKSGDYGRLNYIICRLTYNLRKFGAWGKFRHEMQDPILIEAAVHHFDVLRSLSGSDAQTVFARTWNPPWGEFAGDSTGFVMIEMKNGVKCFYEGAKANASTMSGWTTEYLRAECEHGTLELDKRRLRVLNSDAGEEPVSKGLPLLEQDVWMNSWLTEMFCDWLNGGTAPQSTVDDNIQCAALLFAAVESAHKGIVIDVQDFLQRHLSKME